MLFAADLIGCSQLATMEPDALSSEFTAALERAGATVVKAATHHFDGGGSTSVLVLAESHAVLHTWPETGIAHVDIFSCTARLKSLAAINDIARALGAASLSVREVPRADGHNAADSR
jgi:S-adenosylmethionine decarboxylase proenzyme